MTDNPNATSPESFADYLRFPARTPLQWDNTTNAGFSTAKKTWLPVLQNYTIHNIDLQNRQNVSHLKVFRTLMKLRDHATFKYGSIEFGSINEKLLVYKRAIDRQPTAELFIIVLNLGTEQQTINLNKHFGNLPRQMKVEVVSIHSKNLLEG